MTLEIVPVLRPAPDAPPRTRRRRAVPWLLAAGFAAQVCVRLWFARARTGPVANPDETGYLLAARLLSGGHGGDMSGSTFYQGGYPALLVPAYWFSHDPVTVYTIALAINAVVGAALFPLGYVAARRFGLSRRTALPLAWGAALLPATTFFGEFVLADAVLPTIVLAWLCLLQRPWRQALEGLPSTGAACDGCIAPARLGARCAIRFSQARTWLRSRSRRFGSSRGRGYGLGPGDQVASRGALRSWLSRERVAVVRDAGAAGAVAAFAAAVHSRGEVVLAVHVVTLAALTVAGAVRRRGAVVAAGAAGLAVTAGGYAVAAAVNGHVRAELYPGGVLDLAGNLGERFTTGAGQGWALSGAAGQIWYLAVSTWGLGGVGLAAVAAVLLRRRSLPADRVMAGVLLAVTFAIAYASSAALPDEHRVGNYAYGRYLSCVALVYALAGAAALLRAGLRSAMGLVAAAAAIVGAAGLWVRLYAGERLHTYKFIGFDFPETSFLTGDRGALHLTAASLAALGLLCGFLALGRVPRAGAAVAACALAVTNLAALAFLFGTHPDRVRPAPPLPGAPKGGVVADASVGWEVRTMLVHPVWWTRIGRIDVRRDRPATGVCTVLVQTPDGTSPEASWPAHPAGWLPHANRSWSIRWVAWHDPSCDQ
ncbi:hypothetical protein GCM10009527_045150 [Actinomadura nitritigenes]|uniref:Integral membrane protein n=1 Tax=Actinomadura nitritigenes TaxID=134602 RepID=A0ABS3R8F6_9ACTN|nr:hypothetical protein [Actinomadura nitritigenes]MBO2442337.1 hypothetical protein [Actinomadura nitritigenes]